MTRTIKDSTDLLKTSLTEIGTALTNKNIEGGVENLKVSQVAGLIDQIESGGGSSVKSPIEITSVKWGDYTELTNGGTVTVDEWESPVNIELNVVVKDTNTSLWLFLRDENGSTINKAEFKHIYNSTSKITINNLDAGSDAGSDIYVGYIDIKNQSTDIPDVGLLWKTYIYYPYEG